MIKNREFRKLSNGIRRAVKDPDGFLRQCKGVIHIGAHEGQERNIYAESDLNVVWIEPIPSVFSRLEENLRLFPKQVAYQYLVSDQDDRELTFHISNNDGLSSSVFDMKDHLRILPDIHYTSKMTLKTRTFLSIVKEEKIDLDSYDALVMDTQGSELLILKGCEEILHKFSFIKSEASDFELYKDGCQFKELSDWLAARGFLPYTKNTIVSKRNLGRHFDVVFKKSTKD